MRRLLTLSLLIMLLSAYVPSQAAQSSVYIANPTEQKIELSGVEPPPPGIADELKYTGGGGGIFKTPLLESPLKPYWLNRPAYGAGLLRACGYPAQGDPSAFLSYPSGRRQPLTVVHIGESDVPNALTQENGSNWTHAETCYTFTLSYALGMEMGTYALTLSHPNGDLQYQWLVGYPLCRTALIAPDPNDENVSKVTTPLTHWLAGYQPGESLDLYFYRNVSSQSGDQQYSKILQFVAKRTLTFSDSGDLLFTFSVARSAPFKTGELFLYLSKPFTKPGVDARFAEEKSERFISNLYQDHDPSENRFCTGELTYAVTSAEAQVLYAEAKPDAQKLAELPKREPLMVLATTGTLNKGVADLWYRIRLVDGREGWMRWQSIFPESFAQTDQIDPVRGYAYQIMSSGVPDDKDPNVYHPRPTLLKETPDLNAPDKGDVTGKTMYVIGCQPFDPSVGYSPWCEVQDHDGLLRGWLPPVVNNQQLWDLFSPLPWRLDSLRETPTGFTCPNAPTPRLKVGGWARVLPGDSNNLNNMPSKASPDAGIVRLASIPPNMRVRLVDGPVCNQNIVWWKAYFGANYGWTGEGTGKDYWMEPAD